MSSPQGAQKRLQVFISSQESSSAAPIFVLQCLIETTEHGSKCMQTSIHESPGSTYLIMSAMRRGYARRDTK